MKNACRVEGCTNKAVTAIVLADTPVGAQFVGICRTCADNLAADQHADEAGLRLEVDGGGDLTLWHFRCDDDPRPEALVRECDVHPIVWRLLVRAVGS